MSPVSSETNENVHTKMFAPMKMKTTRDESETERKKKEIERDKKRIRFSFS